MMSNPAAIDPLTARVLGMPLVGAAAQFAFLGVIIGLIYRVGRMFGGQGDLIGSAKVVIWINAIMLMIQFVQLLLLFITPALAAVLAFLTIFWLIWAFAAFIGALHDFSNTVLVIAGIFVVAMIVFFTLGMLATLLGIDLQGLSDV